MSEWKDIDKRNIPSDILVKGKYAFRKLGNFYEDITDYAGIVYQSDINLFSDILSGGLQYSIHESKAPTHSEIMTKWWNSYGTWLRVQKTTFSEGLNCQRYYFNDSWENALYFNDRRSDDIPPESE